MCLMFFFVCVLFGVGVCDVFVCLICCFARVRRRFAYIDRVYIEILNLVGCCVCWMGDCVVIVLYYLYVM